MSHAWSSIDIVVNMLLVAKYWQMCVSCLLTNILMLITTYILSCVERFSSSYFLRFVFFSTPAVYHFTKAQNGKLCKNLKVNTISTYQSNQYTKIIVHIVCCLLCFESYLNCCCFFGIFYCFRVKLIQSYFTFCVRA